MVNAMTEKKKLDYTYKNYKNIFIATTCLIIGYMVSLIGLRGLDLYFALKVIGSGNVTPEQIKSIEQLLEFLTGFFIHYYFITGISFLYWLDGASKNALSFKPVESKFTPGWQVAYYFIPILNFFVPYKGMKEIWRVSKKPHDWKNTDNSVSPIVGWWWFFWITSWLIGIVSKQLGKSGDIFYSMLTYCVHNLSLFFSAFFLLLIILKVQNMQNKQSAIQKQLCIEENTQ